MDKIRTRFAPSPTGYLHLGTLRTAVYTYLLARHNGGTFILRVEDTDTQREVPGALENIYASMRKAGLEYDEGPDVGGDFGPYIQTQRKDLYLPYAWQLVESRHAYPCFCTKDELDVRRAQAEARGETFKYDKHCANIPIDEAKARVKSGEEYVIRQNIPTTGRAGFDDVLFGHVEVDCATLDDNVLIKADGLPTYNFANIIDDHLMRITHVMRGTEYLSSAPKYNLLYDAFGWEKPVYIHLPPIMKDATRKLSKRKGDPSFEDLLEQGFLKDAIINCIVLLGWSPGDDREFFTLPELVEVFTLKGLNKSPAIFDMNKLIWFNSEYIKRLPLDEYIEHAMPWIESGLKGKQTDTARLAQLLQTRTDVFSNIPSMLDWLAARLEYDNELYINKKMKTNAEVAKNALRIALPALRALPEWTEESIHECLKPLPEQNQMKNGQMFWPVRIALTGKASTPGGAIEVAYLLGKDEAISRLEAAILQLESAAE